MIHGNLKAYLHLTLFQVQIRTLPETNIAPENGWLEDWFPFGMASCQVLVRFRGCI